MLPHFNNNASPPPPPTPSTSEIESFNHAARDGDIASVTRYLDSYGPTIINAQDSIQARAITWAAFSGHTEIVKLLLDRGADIESHGTNGKPALSWAAECGRLETLALLLDRGASLENQDDSGLTPVDYAQRSSNTAVTEYIDQWVEDKKQGILRAAQRVEEQKESDARAVLAERLKKLKDSAPGFKIQPKPRPPRNPGWPKR